MNPNSKKGFLAKVFWGYYLDFILVESIEDRG
jgi:hypothetical protein